MLRLSEYDSRNLTSQPDIADYFEECAALYGNKKAIANWITQDLMAHMNRKNSGIRDIGVTAANLIELLKMIDSQSISGKIAKDVLAEMVDTKGAAAEIVGSKKLSQISDKEKIGDVIKDVLSRNEKSVNDYKSGKKNALTFLVGQIMRQTKGQANPAVVNELLKKHLGD